MRYRQDYSLYPVKKGNGRTIYYYRIYDETGKRTSGKSTGQTSKAAAHEYMKTLIREGKLIKGRNIDFSEYARNWWIWDKCRYLKTTQSTGGKITRDYADIARGYLTKHILPYFERIKLTEINARKIEDWRIKLLETNALSPKTINNIYAVLRKMLNEAERLEYISRNPISKINPLHEEGIKKSFLTIPEVKELLKEEHWSDPLCYAANLLSASTGIRLGEVVALRSEYVYQDFITVQHSYSRKYGIKETKTRDIRDIPIPQKTSTCIMELKKRIPVGFIFSNNAGKTPIYYRMITDHLYRALESIGITDDERRRRNITFHSWRHFFNSLLRSRGIIDSKLQKLTGHKTLIMTEHYTHFRLEDFKDVVKVQESIFES